MKRRHLASCTCVLLLISAATAHGQQNNPPYERIRAELHRDAVLRVTRQSEAPSAGSPERASALRPAPSTRQQPTTKHRGSAWTRVLIGAGLGAVAGAVVGTAQCDGPDPECTAIAAPAGAFVGAGIGAAVGAIVHAIKR
jgi:hypothetical protein